MDSLNLAIGQTVLLKSSILDQNGNQMVFAANQVGHLGGAAYTNWVSSNTAIATVTNGPGTKRGAVTGVSTGSATITASYTDPRGNIATLAITVTVYLAVATSIQAIIPIQ